MKPIKPIILIVALLALSSCRTVRVVEQAPVPVYDTLSQKVFLHDSIYIDRWHTVYQQADTVYVRDSIAVIKYSLITDTAYRYIERPVTVTRTEQVEVKKPLAWWQKGLMWAGLSAIIFLLMKAALWFLHRRTS